MNHMKRSVDTETRGSPSMVISDLEKRKYCVVLYSSMIATKMGGETVAFWKLYLMMLAGASCSLSPVMGASTGSV